MLIGTVNRNGNTILYTELISDTLLNSNTINELQSLMIAELPHNMIKQDLKVTIIDTERKNVFHFSVDNISISFDLDIINE